GMETVAAKRQSDVKKSLQSFMSHFFPEADKVYSTETPTEALAILRMITAQAPKGVKWREIRPYMLADSVDFEPSAEDAQIGRLALTGYLRGANLSANRLVHIPNFGDYQIEQIYHVPVAAEAAKGDAIEEDDEPVALDKPDAEHQDSLVDANEPNTLNNEQTWPEDEEMDDWNTRMQEMEANEARIAAKGQRTITVPKGTSSYQAAWIAATEGDDDDNESDGSDTSSDMDDDDDNDMASGSDEDDDEEEYEEMVVGADGKIVGGDDDEDNDDAGSEDGEGLPSAEEEALQLKAYLKERERQNRDDVNFPDEVDTPMEISARKRFARFRGLQSFRTSPWDPYENLPLDYARIFQFESFKRTQQRVLRMAADSPAKAGMRIRVVLRAVPAQVAAAYNPSRPFVAFGLMQHEHQMSVVHFTVMRSEGYAEPVRSKDPLVAHFGFRRYNVQPLFSQHSLGGGSNSNGVHKFERFLKHGIVSVGTIYAPIQFGSVPVSLYLPTPASGGQPEAIPTLVATGSSLEVNPSRILAKRIILTGAPFKIHKRSAVIRYMFFSPEDVIWFKPVQLHTKHGRTGHIFESLGTHGYMKCVFDGPIKQMDTVCMNLYKRVFPKWTTSLWSEHAQDEEQKQQWVGLVTSKIEEEEAMEL
ncbi:ribosome biogenesis protein tsr1, partial [Coemansia sp. RSA 2052]